MVEVKPVIQMQMLQDLPPPPLDPFLCPTPTPWTLNHLSTSKILFFIFFIFFYFFYFLFYFLFYFFLGGGGDQTVDPLAGRMLRT